MSDNNNATGHQEFDYIIIGAGTAGCLLANRLSANPENRVLLIEAGGRDNYHWIHIPVGYLYCIDNPRTDWRFRTEPDPGLNGRSLIYPRGKTLGGCSSINGMLYIRGQARDYQQWAEITGEDAWNWDNCLPDFMRHEDHYRLDEGGDADPEHRKYHGHGGEWRVEHQRLKWKVLEDFATACVEAGIPRTRDFNRGDNEGVDYFEVNQRSGWRWNTSKAFLRNAEKRSNLTLWHSTHVLGLETENAGSGPRCVGVRVERSGGDDVIARAKREVILSAGAIGSPQLLQLSGIGDPKELKRHGIEVKQALPGVGQNLQDHLSVGVEYERIGDGPFVGTLRWDRLLMSMAQAYFFGTGFATEMPGPLTGYIKTKEDLPQPDLQLLARFIPPESQPWFPGYKPKPKDAFMVRPVVLHPKSRGELKLASANPADHALIYQKFLSEPEDRALLREGIGIVKEIAGQKPLDTFRGPEIQPAGESLDDFIKRTAWTVHHPPGTCKMGPDSDPYAVLDEKCRVRGVEGLRVVDASIMPTIISANTNITTIAMAEKAADLILND